VATQQCILSVVELHGTASHIKIWSVAQQCVYCNFMSPVTVNVLRSSCKVSGGALKQKNVRLLMAFLRRTVVAKQVVMPSVVAHFVSV
jgi:hypothetical protein